MRIGPDTFGVEQRFQRDVSAKIAGQLIANLRMTLCRYGADIDTDHGPVWNRIDIESALYRADIERRGAEHIMTRHIEVEILQRRYGTRCFVDALTPFSGMEP